MSGLDIFAWIVLIILVASVVAVFCIAGWLPGHIAKSRGHPWARGGDRGRLGHADLRLCAVAGRADLGLCRRARAAHGGDAAMIVAMLSVYLVLLFALVQLRHRPLQPVLEGLAVHRAAAAARLGLFIPMGWGAPQGAGAGGAQFGRDRADVAGEVIDVPVEANKPLKAGDVLFRIDPVPYRGAGQGDRGAAQAFGDAPGPDDATARARLRPRLRRRAAAVRGRPAQGAARGAQVESGQDDGARAGRRLRRPISRCARARGSPTCRWRR